MLAIKTRFLKFSSLKKECLLSVSSQTCNRICCKKRRDVQIILKYVSRTLICELIETQHKTARLCRGKCGIWICAVSQVYAEPIFEEKKLIISRLLAYRICILDVQIIPLYNFLSRSIIWNEALVLPPCSPCEEALNKRFLKHCIKMSACVCVCVCVCCCILNGFILIHIFFKSPPLLTPLPRRFLLIAFRGPRSVANLQNQIFAAKLKAEVQWT